ncbi:MAG: type IX secretion system membrane protein PorP/SprF [Chryseolinea sp.]
MSTSFRKFATLGAILLILSAKVIHAQQDPAYSHFMYNGLAINPGVAGSAETFSATAILRKQWAGIPGAPETQTLNIDGPVWNKKLGLGLSIINDKIGVIQNLVINTQYAYRLQFEKSTLSLGLQAGMSGYKADYTSVVTNSQNTSDNSFGENTSRIIFNFGSGIYYYSERFFAGFSVPHIINQRLDDITDENGLQSRQYRHYFITTGYVFDAGEKFKIKPSLLLKVADGAPVQLDVNSSFWYNETVSLGFSYRTNDSFSTLVQVQLAKRFRVGYAYDFIISPLSRYTSGNNEVMLRYELHRDNLRILTPRFF